MTHAGVRVGPKTSSSQEPEVPKVRWISYERGLRFHRNEGEPGEVVVSRAIKNHNLWLALGYLGLLLLIARAYA
jgi:hypothetical protein